MVTARITCPRRANVDGDVGITAFMTLSENQTTSSHWQSRPRDLEIGRLEHTNAVPNNHYCKLQSPRIRHLLYGATVRALSKRADPRLHKSEMFAVLHGATPLVLTAGND
jgi:hypothetical protein